MQQQCSRLFFALASNNNLHVVLLSLAKLVYPHTADFHLEGCCSLADVHRRFRDARLKVSDQAVPGPYLLGRLLAYLLLVQMILNGVKR